MNNSILLDKFEAFKEKNTEGFSTWINTAEHNLPALFKDYEYPVNSWPVLIDTHTAEKLRKLCIKIPELIQRIPELYFDNDIEKIAEYYYGGDSMIAQFALMCHGKNAEIGCRLDLTWSTDGFKILEANIGSSIGGWQVQSFEPVIRKLNPYLTDIEAEASFHSENTQLNYMQFLVDKILEFVQVPDDEINVFISLGHLDDEALKKESLIFFNELLQKELAGRGLKGQAYTSTMTALELVQGKLKLGTKDMHSVLILNMDAEEIPSDLFRAYIMGSIYFPDHLGVAMYGDKRNLGLLRELAEKGTFTQEENELLLSSIPWTAMVENTTVNYNKQPVNIAELLKEEPEKWVIKAAQGYQGKDVFIGKFSSPEEWDQAIQIALKESKFIAQEFSESLNFTAPNKNNEWTPHKLIWGAFGFGKNYGGVWVRMSEVKTDVGIINSAAGAVEAIVYEMEEMMVF